MSRMDNSDTPYSLGTQDTKPREKNDSTKKPQMNPGARKW